MGKSYSIIVEYKSNYISIIINTTNLPIVLTTVDNNNLVQYL